MQNSRLKNSKIYCLNNKFTEKRQTRYCIIDYNETEGKIRDGNTKRNFVINLILEYHSFLFNLGSALVRHLGEGEGGLGGGGGGDCL